MHSALAASAQRLTLEPIRTDSGAQDPDTLTRAGAQDPDTLTRAGAQDPDTPTRAGAQDPDTLGRSRRSTDRVVEDLPLAPRLQVEQLGVAVDRLSSCLFVSFARGPCETLSIENRPFDFADIV